MQKAKKIIIILLILLFIMAVSIGIAIYIINKQINEYTEDNPNYKTSNGEEYREIKNSYTPEKLTNINKYNTVNNCVSEYLKKIYYSYNESGLTEYNPDYWYKYKDNADWQTTEDSKKSLFNMLDKSYIANAKITTENILANVPKADKSYEFIINQIRVKETGEKQKYLIEGKLKDNTENIYMFVTLDDSTTAFSIEPYPNTNTDNIDTINFEVGETIEKNADNGIKYSDMDEADVCNMYLTRYKMLILNNNLQEVYDHIDQEYKSKRFIDARDFEIYANNNKTRISNIELNKYVVINREGYTEYRCQDKEENTYIFKVADVLNYSIILDTYTIDLPEFVEQYNKVTEQEKVAMNIQKIFKAFNNGDYRFAYNKLDNTFKANNFKTETDFEQYIKQNFFANNNIENTSWKKQGDIFIFAINIIDKTENNKNKVQKTFIVKLKEGTDFIMSFNV